MAVAAETAELGAKENFAALLDESLGVAAGSSGLEGTVVKGQVIAIENDFALIDVGLKSEGRVPLKEFSVGGAAPEIKVGDTVEVFLERMEDKNGEASLSREKARREEAWTQLEKNFQANERVTGTIFGRPVVPVVEKKRMGSASVRTRRSPPAERSIHGSRSV